MDASRVARPASPTCDNPGCTNPGSKRCAQCRGLFFCCRDCQAAAWGSHKALCQEVARDPNGTCLLLDGMGPLGPGRFYTKKVKEALRGAGVTVATINVRKGSKLPRQVGSILSEIHRFTSCIVLGWGSGGVDIRVEEEFGNSGEFREKIVPWVENGGRFIVQGENPQHYGNWPQWFGKQWGSDEYLRTDFVCHAKSDDDIHWCTWYHKAKGAVTDSFNGGKHKYYNVKAVMLKGVSPEDCLFGTSRNSSAYSLVPTMRGIDVEEGLCAIALGKFGEGSISYFGDVNAEEDTCNIMAIIARGI